MKTMTEFAQASEINPEVSFLNATYLGKLARVIDAAIADLGNCNANIHYSIGWLIIARIHTAGGYQYRVGSCSPTGFVVGSWYFPEPGEDMFAYIFEMIQQDFKKPHAGMLLHIMQNKMNRMMAEDPKMVRLDYLN